MFIFSLLQSSWRDRDFNLYLIKSPTNLSKPPWNCMIITSYRLWVYSPSKDSLFIFLLCFLLLLLPSAESSNITKVWSTFLKPHSKRKKSNLKSFKLREKNTPPWGHALVKSQVDVFTSSQQVFPILGKEVQIKRAFWIWNVWQEPGIENICLNLI